MHSKVFEHTIRHGILHRAWTPLVPLCFYQTQGKNKQQTARLRKKREHTKKVGKIWRKSIMANIKLQLHAP